MIKQLIEEYVTGSILSSKTFCYMTCCLIHTKNFIAKNLLTGLLGPYWEIRSLILFVRAELVRAVRKSEGLVLLVRTQ